jgi:hypothetical protein
LLRFEILDDPRPVTSEMLAPDPSARAAAGERLERLAGLLREHPLPGEPMGEETSSLEKAQTATDGGSDLAAPQANAILRQSVPADQLRRDQAYQQTGNITERAKRAQVVGKTVQPPAQTADAPAGADEQPTAQTRDASKPAAASVRSDRR